MPPSRSAASRYGILSVAAAKRLSVPRLANKRVAIEPHPTSERAALHVWHNGEYLGASVSLGVDGIIPDPDN